jgi:hypothetical protein
MPDLVIAIVSSILGGGIVAGIAAMITARSTARKTDMERAMMLIDKLQEDNGTLRKNLYRLETQNDLLRTGIMILIDQLQQMGVQPRWTPALVRLSEEKDG